MRNDEEFMRQVRKANRDPLVRAAGAGMWLADVLFFGAPADAVYNWFCALQDLRYRHLVRL